MCVAYGMFVIYTPIVIPEGKEGFLCSRYGTFRKSLEMLGLDYLGVAGFLVPLLVLAMTTKTT